eukprot:1157593-Pelagomonas_calceolata.AAC.7
MSGPFVESLAEHPTKSILLFCALLGVCLLRVSAQGPIPAAHPHPKAPTERVQSLGPLQRPIPVQSSKELRLEFALLCMAGPFQRPIPIQSSNGLCLEELRLLYFHDIKKQETLDNMQKVRGSAAQVFTVKALEDWYLVH